MVTVLQSAMGLTRLVIIQTFGSRIQHLIAKLCIPLFIRLLTNTNGFKQHALIAVSKFGELQNKYKDSLPSKAHSLKARALKKDTRELHSQMLSTEEVALLTLIIKLFMLRRLKNPSFY